MPFSDKGEIVGVAKDRGDSKLRQALINSGYHQITREEAEKLSKALSERRGLARVL